MKAIRAAACLGFSLVELLVVIMIIALLIAILMPALANSRLQAQSVKCKANLHTNYSLMLMYANENKGYMFPQGLGSGQPRTRRWPLVVFRPPLWNPPSMICPTDVEPAEEHSYIVNNHFQRHQIRYSNTRGVSPSDVILMGEKRSTEPDYYMDLRDFTRVVETYRHGLKLGSNYLFMDSHVDTVLPRQAVTAIDPWDPGVPPTDPDAPPPGTPN